MSKRFIGRPVTRGWTVADMPSLGKVWAPFQVFVAIDERKQTERSVLAKMESGLVRRLALGGQGRKGDAEGTGRQRWMRLRV